MAMGVYQLELCDYTNTAYQDVTTISFDKKGSYRLNRPAVWTFRVPALLCPDIRKGHRMKVRRNGSIVFNGIVMFLQRTGDENMVWISVTVVDPVVIFGSRVVRDDDGTFAYPQFGFPISGAELIRRAVENSIDNPGDGTPGSDVADHEGQMGIITSGGTFDESLPPAVDMGIDDLVDWPITIAELYEMLVNTGMVDIYLTYLDEEDNDDMAILNAVNQKGSDLSGTVHFDFATGDYSVKTIRHTEDLKTLCNKLWYDLGPKRSLRRWQTNVTGSADFSGFPSASAILALRTASRAQYNTWMTHRTYDSGQEYNIQELYKGLWLTESLLRVNGRELLSVQPKPDAPFLPFEDYTLGDIVTVNAGPALGVEFSAQQRVYGFDLDIDKEGVERPSELIASADGET